MDTEPAPPPAPTIFLYGFRDPAVLRIDPTAIAKFIMGIETPMDHELIAALRSEFNAQEVYRGRLFEAVASACAELLHAAFENVGPIEQPVVDVRSAFWRGYACGKYEAYSAAASALSEIPIVAAMAVEDKDAAASAEMGKCE